MIRTFTWITVLLIVNILNAADIHRTQYFQQHVKYKIDAKLDINLNRIEATQILIYTNHSPDTLRELHFHLYLNKYRKNAYQENGLRQKEAGSIEIFKIVENDSMDVVFLTDHTLLNLMLNERLLPEDSVKLEIVFASRLPPASGRYGYYGNHYDVGNWFPTPVVYDHAGWHLNQHIDNEFYQEWGDFDVNITVPKGFILGATGDLLNPDRMYARHCDSGKEGIL